MCSIKEVKSERDILSRIARAGTRLSKSQGKETIRLQFRPSALVVQQLRDQFVDQLWIGSTFRGFHDLSYEETKKLGLATAVLLHLLWVVVNDILDESLELPRV